MTDLAQAFSALGDTTRLTIVDRLLSDGEVSAGMLHDASGLSAPAVSRHLKVLRHAGLIRQRIQGTHRFYSIEPDAMEAISSWTISRREFWTQSLDRLDTALRED
jgi:DNA-binding transcriptional ArsR family regulator